MKITGTYHALITELWSKFDDFQRQYPDVTLELHSEIRFVDIVAERFDAGIRMGEMLAQDMIAVKVSEPMTMCCVATPDYWAAHGKPATPDELRRHQCLRLRLPTHGGLLDWAFTAPDGTPLTPPLSQAFIGNSDHLLLHACKQDKGIIWTEKSFVAQALSDGTLQTALDDWAKTYPPYYLYYPNRNPSPLLKALVEVIKVR
ncbi:LysR substrate binding domain-containing protein [Cricetibacter osteomyelitidis]|uniref:LysR substrate binding domain-containing protein n=1 Tax=Cricetibacter osteomyelitidis TaxID=1521931 RepID=A0A4R2T3G5_9PAST|nr:LysR substrate-binding domain-containing protein [Cricetibacter osteomyelitidis]TCP95991.1 LysR substrate binding domain-containing protein [Cricetibacter osteomyelitidis]